MEMEMIRLNPDMMARYEIDDRRPGQVNAVAFGMGPRLMGGLNRLIDEAGIGLGVACVQAGEVGYAGWLEPQGGLYTVVLRGYEGENPVHREQVVQCVRAAIDPEANPEALDALAADPAVALAILDAEYGIAEAALEAMGRFMAVRRRAGLTAPAVLCLGDAASAASVRDALAAASDDGDGLRAWLTDWAWGLLDSLAFRSDPAEAARLCREMNYRDSMLHLAEPYARLTLCAPEPFQRRFPLDRASGVRFVDAPSLEAAYGLHRTAFDGGLCLLACAGWLNGCDTLFDAMRHERLRRFAGSAFTGELLPSLYAEAGQDRTAVDACVIDTFARFENPLNRNGLLPSAHHLLTRFARGPARLMARWADDRFEPPRGLAFALAATIMLYAGARENPETGLYEVARGKAVEPLCDDREKLRIFATLSHDMPPESLAYAALADRELWDGLDLRDIEGLEARVALDIAAMQREPGYLPEA